MIPELEQLHRLSKQVELAILAITNGRLIDDPSASAKGFDFIVGNFGVSEFIVDQWEGSYMPQIDGRSFRCECGCNVFQKSVTKSDRYKCNSCDMVYQS